MMIGLLGTWCLIARHWLIGEERGRTAFADAIGHVTAICVQKRVQELVTHLVEMYTTKDDDVSRCTVAYTLLQVAIRASDSLKKCFKDVIPVAFLGRSDPIDEAQKSFERLWEEIGIGQPERLYTQEIVRCISSGFVSSSWNIKKQSAASVSLLADSISLHLRPVRFVGRMRCAHQCL